MALGARQLGFGGLGDSTARTTFTPQIVAVGRATETDTAFAVTAAKIREVGQATETDTAFAFVAPVVSGPACGFIPIK